MGTVVVKRKTYTKVALSYIILGIGMIFVLTPIVWMIMTSLKPQRQMVMGASPVFIFEPTTKYFEEILGIRTTDCAFVACYPAVTQFINSIIIASGAAALSVILGIVAAYGFSRHRFKGSNALAFTILTFRFLPVIAFILPLFILFQKVWGIADTHIGVILAYGAFDVPFTTWVLRSFVHDIPKDLDEAMLMDGGTRWDVIRRIILPLAKPGIAVTMILAFTFVWNDFVVAYVLTRKVTRTIPVFMSGLRVMQGVLYEHLFAAATIQFLPLLAMVTLLEKHIVRGLTFGAVK